MLKTTEQKICYLKLSEFFFEYNSISYFKIVKLGGGQDTQATVSWPPPSIPDIQWNMLLWLIN